MQPNHSAVASRIAVGIGLLLTLGLISGYRPWGETPANAVFLLGPIILAAGAASDSARHRNPKAVKDEGSSAGRVTGLGLLMLLIGGCPWLYTPLLTGGESNSASGMLGTIIFLLIGMPGLAVTAVGLINLASQRRARRKQPDRQVVAKASGDEI